VRELFVFKADHRRLHIGLRPCQLFADVRPLLLRGFLEDDPAVFGNAVTHAEPLGELE
jgi:hypothetical protein